MRRDYMLSNAQIVLTLLRSGYAHSCPRCGRGMHVRHASGLCVWCFNDQSSADRKPKITRTVTRHSSSSAGKSTQPSQPSSAPA
jgi:hypothetical protein